ncbi:unnamed protein product, partial [Vitrella brassicaformis CCMP3155]
MSYTLCSMAFRPTLLMLAVAALAASDNIRARPITDRVLEEGRCSTKQKHCEKCGKAANGREVCELCEAGFFLRGTNCPHMYQCRVLSDVVIGEGEANDVAEAGLVSSFAECHHQCATTPKCQALSFYIDGRCVLKDGSALKKMSFELGVKSARLDCEKMDDVV